MEILVSRSLAPYLTELEIDCSKFMFMKKLKAELEFANGLVLAT